MRRKLSWRLPALSKHIQKGDFVLEIELHKHEKKTDFNAESIYLDTGKMSRHFQNIVSRDTFTQKLSCLKYLNTENVYFTGVEMGWLTTWKRWINNSLEIVYLPSPLLFLFSPWRAVSDDTTHKSSPSRILNLLFFWGRTVGPRGPAIHIWGQTVGPRGLTLTPGGLTLWECEPQKYHIAL